MTDMIFTFSMARLFLQMNFAPIVATLCLIAFIKTNVNFPDNINRDFLLACISAILLIISDNVRFVTARMDSPSLFRYISTATGYSLRAFFLYLMTIIASRYKTKMNSVIAIPFAVCVLVSFISIFPFSHGIMFSFSEANKYIRGPLGYLSHLVCFFYAVMIIFYSIRNYNHNKYEPIVLIIIEIAASIATVMETKFKYDFILSQVLSSSIIFYYFFLATITYKRDPLTHFLNRHCFYLELSHHTKANIVLLSMDLNNLKVYNDTKGHLEGDKALVTTAEYMTKFFEHDAKLFRIGGDEFMAIFPKADLSKVEGLVKDFQEALSKTEYRVACGFAQYSADKDNIEKVITQCDKKMYEDKARLKSL